MTFTEYLIKNKLSVFSIFTKPTRDIISITENINALVSQGKLNIEGDVEYYRYLRTLDEKLKQLAKKNDDIQEASSIIPKSITFINNSTICLKHKDCLNKQKT